MAAGGGTAGRRLRAATDLLRLTRPSVASRDERRAKTIWEVAEEAGLRTAVVNWWATWPAPAGRGGIVITDRALLRLERGGALDAEIAPAALYEPLRAAVAGDPAAGASRGTAASVQSRIAPTAAVLQRSAELDATARRRWSRRFRARRGSRVVYLPGLDIAQHALLARRGGPPDAVGGCGAPRRASWLLPVPRGLLGALLTPAGDPIVVIVTQPGRVQARADGVLASYVIGRAGEARSDMASRPRSVVDIAPTLLYALGHSDSVANSPAKPRHLIVELAEFATWTRYGRPFVAPAAREGKPLDQEMIDRLRSLGYVK